MFHNNSQPAPGEDTLDELLLSSRIRILRLIQTLVPHDLTTAVDDKRRPISSRFAAPTAKSLPVPRDRPRNPAPGPIPPPTFHPPIKKLITAS